MTPLGTFLFFHANIYDSPQHQRVLPPLLPGNARKRLFPPLNMDSVWYRVCTGSRLACKVLLVTLTQNQEPTVELEPGL